MRRGWGGTAVKAVVSAQPMARLLVLFDESSRPEDSAVVGGSRLAQMTMQRSAPWWVQMTAGAWSHSRSNGEYEETHSKRNDWSTYASLARPLGSQF